MKKNIYFVATIIVVLLMLLIFILIRKNQFKIEDVKYENILEVVKYDGFSIVYNGEVTEEIRSLLKSFNTEYLIDCYSSEMSLEQINQLISEKELSTDSKKVYILFLEGEVVDILTSDTTREKFVELIEKYLFNKIPESERYYQVLSTADEYIKKVNSKNYTIAVFGIGDCTYCDLYLPVINDIARDYNLSIYYFNRDTYDTEEYQKIMVLDFEIPAKCTTTGYSTTLSKSFPKPMTIITKSGEFVDCIRGYVTEEVVVDMLSEYKIIKEK